MNNEVTGHDEKDTDEVVSKKVSIDQFTFTCTGTQ
jgi:hypothetical protein